MGCSFPASFLLPWYYTHNLRSSANTQLLKNVTEVPEKIENALAHISSALSGIGIGEDFPRCLSQEYLDDIRASSIFLTVAIMDCLCAVIKWTNQNGLS
jgi:hypothetical protein